MASQAGASAQGAATVFDVTAYGANGADQQEDTAGIAAAIEAARLNGGGIVSFPAGTYLVSPPGTAMVGVHIKQAGAWTELAASVGDGDKVGKWHFLNTAPTSAQGAISDKCLDRRSGRVYSKTSTGWRFEQFLVQGSGEGWTAGHAAPAAGTGASGDIYLRWHIVLDNQNGAVFQLSPFHNNITFRGEGADRSVLSFKTWSGGDPMDYQVDKTTRKIVRSAIPANSNGRYQRGSLFVMKGVGTTAEFSNIHWDGLEMRGNTIANGKHGWYTPYDDVAEWDISNKGIVFTFGGRPMHNISVRNSSVNGWRGEILYKGGSNYAEILIENCDIFETNSSAVSISGNMIMRNSRIWNAYNGVENYSTNGQFSEIYDSDIDLGRSFRGTNGVVYLGTEDAHLIVDGCTINGAINAAIFLSDFASNLTITNNRISNARWGVYFYHMNLYKLPAIYNDVLIQNNIFAAEGFDMDFAILAAINSCPAKNWTIVDNEVVTNGTNAVRFFFSSHHKGDRTRHNAFIERNTLPTTTLVGGSGLVPVISANHSQITRINTYTAENGIYSLSPINPAIEITYLPVDGLVVQVVELERYPSGHVFSTRLKEKWERPERGFEYQPAAWNNLERGYAVYDDAEISFEFRDDGRYHLRQFKAPGSGQPITITQGTVLAARGRETVHLLPNTLTVYDSFSGIPVNASVTVHVNENVRFADNRFIKTPAGGLYDPDASQPVVVRKSSDGSLTFSSSSQVDFASWAGALPPGQRGEMDDPGGHGIPNLLRYAFDMHPNVFNPAALPRMGLSEVTVAGERQFHLTLAYIRRIDDPDLIYIAESSEDLVRWTPLTDAESIDDSDGTIQSVTVTDPEPVNTRPKVFLRVRVERIE